MYAAIDVLSARSAPEGRRPGRAGVTGKGDWFAVLRRKAVAWAARSAGDAALRRQHVRRLAMEQGYTCLEVDAGDPIEMLLLRAGERVIVLSERAARAPHSRVQGLLEGADASAAWIFGPGCDGVPRQQIITVQPACA